MLARKLLLVFVGLLILQSSFQVVHGDLDSWKFKKILYSMLEKSNAQKGLKQSELTLVQRIKSVLHGYSERLEAIQNTKVKAFRPFFDGRFG